MAAPRGGYTVHDLGSIAVAVYIASFYTFAWFPVRGQKQDDRALFQAVNSQYNVPFLYGSILRQEDLLLMVHGSVGNSQKSN